jgi:hypothetical protein
MLLCASDHLIWRGAGKHRGLTPACSGAREPVFVVIPRLRRAPADA